MTALTPTTITVQDDGLRLLDVESSGLHGMTTSTGRSAVELEHDGQVTIGVLSHGGCGITLEEV